MPFSINFVGMETVKFLFFFAFLLTRAPWPPVSTIYHQQYVKSHCYFSVSTTSPGGPRHHNKSSGKTSLRITFPLYETFNVEI